jgi:hypothetical protein
MVIAAQDGDENDGAITNKLFQFYTTINVTEVAIIISNYDTIIIHIISYFIVILFQCLLYNSNHTDFSDHL